MLPAKYFGCSAPFESISRLPRNSSGCSNLPGGEAAGLEPLLLVITDGEANVTLVSEQDVLKELDAIALSMSREKFRVLVVDSSTGVVGNKFLQRLGNLVGGNIAMGGIFTPGACLN